VEAADTSKHSKGVGSIEKNIIVTGTEKKRNTT